MTLRIWPMYSVPDIASTIASTMSILGNNRHRETLHFLKHKKQLRFSCVLVLVLVLVQLNSTQSPQPISLAPCVCRCKNCQALSSFLGLQNVIRYNHSSFHFPCILCFHSEYVITRESSKQRKLIYEGWTKKSAHDSCS